MGRGSEWIRIDLHVHTKGTKKNDQFKSKDMAEFYKLFFRKAFENNIKIIGITDYFNIDNYKKAQEYLESLKYDENLSKEESEFYKTILLVPNIELRILPITKKGKLINLHCLFSPNRVVELDDHFFSELKCNQHKMTNSGIISLGKSYVPDNSDDKCYNEGIAHFHINIEDLKRVKMYFKDDMLIGAANSGTDGVSGINHEDFYVQKLTCLEEFKRQIYKLSDFIFSGSSNDREYFLGKKTSIEEVCHRCGSLKACFHGSDAHSEDKLFKPDLDKNCWIKSEVSFEGIKQVLQEPDDRIIIQEGTPEIKKAYDIIESISFDDEKSGEEIKIFLNQNLNTLIGGKSTGKSMLLKNIVSTINKKYIEEKKVPEFKKLVNFKVNWKDNFSNEERNIEYIPQSYLNKQSNDSSVKSYIDETAEKILLQDINRKKELEIFKENIKRKEENAYKLIDQYYFIEENIKKNEEEAKKLGGIKIIENEINVLSERLGILQEGSNISEEEKSTLKGSLSLLNIIKAREISITEDINRINLLIENEKNKLEEIKKYDEENKKCSSNLKDILSELIDTFQYYKNLHEKTFSKSNWEESFNLLTIKTEYETSKEYWKDIYETLNGNSLRSYPEYTEEIIPNIDNIKKLFNFILTRKIKLRSTHSIPEVLKRFLKNPFILKYKINEKGNDINYMSEGNRSFVLLELLIHLNDNKYPIIIDQPEDDLDNRSIYEDLVKFLREKKKDRQIIVATHNANIVVGADSENIIVANQHGIGTENINDRKFNYKNGGLENKDISGTDTLGKKNIQEHICEILEGGKEAFEIRRKKYNLS